MSLGDAILRKREQQLREAERKARETGATLTDKYYEDKRKYESTRNHYEDLKRRNS